MSFVKRILSLILALVLVIGLLPVTARAGALGNGLVYEVYADHVEITDYTGDATEVVIPAEIQGKPVTVIGSTAFLDAFYLESITIPDSVTRIDYHAFWGCHSLTGIVIPDSVTYIGDYAFCYCASLTDIVIPDSVTSIGDSAFSCCYSLTSIVIPDSITSISDSAFQNCESLTSIVIPDSVTSIGRSAFNECASLTSIVIPDSVTSIGNGAFRECASLTTIVIPDSVTSIGERAFYNCSNLTGIHVDENNPNYSSDDRGVLFDKEKTRLIQAPGAITDSYAIPDSVTSIGDEAFCFCESLTGIVIPDSVASIGERTFYSCLSLIGIHADENSPNYSSDDRGVLFDKEKTRLIQAPGAIADSYVIPDGVTSIGDYAFSLCNNLTGIVIPDSVTYIRNYAFSFCKSLTDIVMPDSITHIGSYAFQAGNSLTDIVIPGSVTYIGYWAFANCDNLTSIRFVGNPPEFGADTIFTTVTATTAYYPVGNPTWLYNVKKDYGGRITWVPYNADHTYEFIAVTAPTCTKKGFTTYTCACSDTYVSDYVDPLGHNFSEGNCIRCGEADPGNGSFDPSNGRFAPDDVLTRGMFCYALWNFLGSPEPSILNPWVDLKESDYYYDAVLWVVEKGIVNGISATEFGLDIPVNRAQAATCLWRSVGCPDGPVDNPFIDVPDGTYFYQSVPWAYAAGYMGPKDAEDTFKPTDTCLYGHIYWGPGDHTHEYTAVVTAPTCTRKGFTTYTCTVCGHSYV